MIGVSAKNKSNGSYYAGVGKLTYDFCVIFSWEEFFCDADLKMHYHRYLEFNLLYDRGVKFGLANENPRVEGVMVSAPPLIAWEYNHKIEAGSEEERLMKILKDPIDWV